ncbi:hypothetical protein BKA67DRAFT_542187 [Truncatella angustata]|uniref:Uncharacterized protein n=1 Tax=Truncatella angustata TaxID=152316 RepID=A0A9P8UC16_9PEZI|nr:uncharacterized protein BKA67DRAFT_542187 [Truncatella angustata]KAH6645217.1 hypothetical protein BKA67DRAFT_542187 [Truncatella angustata]
MLLDHEAHKRANVNAQGGQFGNALHATSSKGHQEIIQILLERGADVNEQDDGDYAANLALGKRSSLPEALFQTIIRRLEDKNSDVRRAAIIFLKKQEIQGGVHLLNLRKSSGLDGDWALLLEKLTDSGYTPERKTRRIVEEFEEQFHSRTNRIGNSISLDEKMALWRDAISASPIDHRIMDMFEDSYGTPATENLSGSRKFSMESLSILQAVPLVTIRLVRANILKGQPKPRCRTNTACSDQDMSVVKPLQSRTWHASASPGILGTFTAMKVIVKAYRKYLRGHLPLRDVTWPQTGQSLIKILQYAVKDNPDILHTLFLLDGIHLTVQRCHNFLTIQVKGNQFAIVEVGEQMGWISTALRSSSQDDSIAAFRLIIQSCELRDSLQKDKETSHRPDTCVDLRSLQTNRPYTAWFGHIRRLLDDVITHSYSRSRVSDLEKKRTAAWYRNPNRRVALRHVGSSHRSLRTDLTRTLLPGYTGEYGGTHCGFDEAR